jgi:hypothetical protein
MKKVLAGILCVAMLSGCARVMTSSFGSVDSAEIAKSSYLGENCMSWFLFFGPFGDASIKSVIDKNAGKKITLVDHKFTPGFFTSTACSQVYGY